MQIKTSGLKGPFHIVSDDGSTLSTQPDFDCALAYVQGTLDHETGRNPRGHTIEIRFNRQIGHRADIFSVTHYGTAEYLVGKEPVSGAASVLEHCLEKSPHRSFVATMLIDDSHYTFDRKSDRANETYNRQRFGDT